MSTHTAAELELSKVFVVDKESWRERKWHGYNSGPWWSEDFVNAQKRRNRESALVSCRLGSRKRRQVECIVGQPVLNAYAIYHDLALGGVHGGPVVAFVDEDNALLVDRKCQQVIGPAVIDGQLAFRPYEGAT